MPLLIPSDFKEIPKQKLIWIFISLISTYVYMHIYIYVHIYIYLYVCEGREKI